MVDPHFPAGLEVLEEPSFRKSEEIKGNGLPFLFVGLFQVPFHNFLEQLLLFEVPDFVAIIEEEAQGLILKSEGGTRNKDPFERLEIFLDLNKYKITSR